MSEQSGAPLMELEGVSQVFQTKRGDVPAVDDVSLALYSGRVMCLVGESGSGKTTTARIAAGLNSPSGGVVRFEGKDVSTLRRSAKKDYRHAVQYVHQDPYASLNPTRTVESALIAPLRKHRIVRSRAAARDRAAELLTKVGLTPPGNFLNKYPHQLSGGQRQRVSVARALTLDPRLIIADEATSMLDVSIRISMLTMLGQLRDELDVGFLFITHDLALAKYFGAGGHTAVMYLGRIVEQGPTGQVIGEPAHPYTRALYQAVPEPDPRLTRQKTGAELRSADIPSLLAIPKGCPFHPRCPMSVPGVCDKDRPDLITVAGHSGQSAACVRLSAVDTEMPLNATLVASSGDEDRQSDRGGVP
ncbi:MAG TPA: ABC transporter ATP-binding protein [Mycobacteriales bacterium]|nr:ABC transporter ATP-binding protein [Mycobacteriales bacterium]